MGGCGWSTCTYGSIWFELDKDVAGGFVDNAEGDWAGEGVICIVGVSIGSKDGGIVIASGDYWVAARLKVSTTLGLVTWKG